MTSAAEWRDVLAEVNQAAGCSHPVRLRGIVLDRSTGELADSAIVVACKDRRAAVCPACSRLYQADAWQLVAAGIRGGKGVSADVAQHPQLFVTLTAPAFGPVHTRPRAPEASRPCRPRRRAGLCPHGVPLACHVRHAVGDPFLGEPLCPECFDYRGAVLWNALVPRLWERTSLELYREIGRAGGLSTRYVRRAARLSYIKVVEFQRRGLVHLHLVVRADGAEGPGDPPPDWLTSGALTDALTAAIGRSSVKVPEGGGSGPSRAVWGSEFDIRELLPNDAGDSTAIAAYVAKYATKTADGTPALAHPVRSAAQLHRLELRPHIARMVQTAWALGRAPEFRTLRLREHAHTLGYTGQFSSKSQRFSTTFGALRRARSTFMQADTEGSFDYDGQWQYVGRGYANPVSCRVAEALAAASPAPPQRLHAPSTNRSTPR